MTVTREYIREFQAGATFQIGTPLTESPYSANIALFGQIFHKGETICFH